MFFFALALFGSLNSTLADVFAMRIYLSTISPLHTNKHRPGSGLVTAALCAMLREGREEDEGREKPLQPPLPPLQPLFMAADINPQAAAACARTAKANKVRAGALPLSIRVRYCSYTPRRSREQLDVRAPVFVERTITPPYRRTPYRHLISGAEAACGVVVVAEQEITRHRHQTAFLLMCGLMHGTQVESEYSENTCFFPILLYGQTAVALIYGNTSRRPNKRVIPRGLVSVQSSILIYFECFIVLRVKCLLVLRVFYARHIIFCVCSSHLG